MSLEPDLHTVLDLIYIAFDVRDGEPVLNGYLSDRGLDLEVSMITAS